MEGPRLAVDRSSLGLAPKKEGDDSGFRCGAGEENRTRMASLEGIRAPTRADSDAPPGLTCLRREAPSLALA
jgi:hypothetical protein